MASDGVVPVEKEWQQIEEEITCSICGDLFTDPKIIPCFTRSVSNVLRRV